MTRPVVRTPANGVSELTSPKPVPDVEVGISSYLPYLTPYRDAWEALRDEDITVRQLTAMRKTDGQARALYRLLTLPIRAALKTATFVPEDNVDGGEEEAEFISQMLTLPPAAGGMVTPLNRVIAQMLMGLFDGFAAFEMVYTAPKTGPLANKWTLKKMAYRPSDTITFLVDNRGDFAGLRQQALFQGRTIDVPIPGEHVAYYAANEEEKRFYGQSYFQAAFYHWDKKFKLYVIAHIAAQRAAVGTRVGKMPPNPNRAEKTKFTQALADLGVAQYISIPEGYTVESLREGGSFDFLAHINHHNSQMSKSILAPFFDDQQGSGGDASLVDFGRQSDAIFMMMLTTIMGEIEDVINNTVIPRFIDWNFGTSKYPRFQFGNLSADQKAQFLEVFKTLATGGQAITVQPEFIHEMEKQMAEEFGLEIDWETVEENMAERAAQLAAAEASAASPAVAGAAPGPPAGPPVVDPSLLPEGFTLTHPDELPITLSDEAAELLTEAVADLVAATRGVPRSGQRKVVRTPAGAKKYGEPIGTPITLDVAQRTAADGVKGASAGARRGKTAKRAPAAQSAFPDPRPAAGSDTTRRVYGGGPGAPAQNPGSVETGADQPRIQRTMSHPDQPGVTLLDYGDGTIAIRDAAGRISARQRFSIQAFLKLGWKVAAKA